jgi:hypothetical protein
MPSLIECIYCCRPGPASREHILQASLGGNLTARLVCDACNTGFSKIDQALAEQSVISHARALHTPLEQPVRLGDTHFMHDVEHDVWQEVQIKNRFSTYVPPQFHFRLPKVWFFGSDRQEKDQFVERLTKRIRAGTAKSIRLRIGPADHCTTIRIVQHRSNDLFVRAPTREEGEEFLELLTDKWSEFETVLRLDPKDRRIESPTILLHLNIGIDDCYRAIAKTAFNFLALRKGVEFVRRPEFDLVRNYIRGLDVQWPTSVGPGQVAFDPRFVRQLESRDPMLIPTTEHLLMLGYAHPHIFACVTLYADYSYLVTLGQVELPSIMDFLPDAHEFSIDKTSNRTIDMYEMADRMSAVQRSQRGG